jgi:hypothetical protein
MKDLFRMLLLVGLAVSVTWAASWVTGRGPPTMVALQEGAAGQGSEPAPDSPEGMPAEKPDATTDATPDATKEAIPEVTKAEIDAAIKEVEKTLSGAGRDAGEAVAEKPLPADLAIPLPSDI